MKVAGTDQTSASLPDTALGGPAIILVEPQLGENIGMCARAMLNCGLTELRIVNPRDGWPQSMAYKAGSGADYVLDNVKLYDKTRDAVEGLNFVAATTARGRDMTKRVLTPYAANKEFLKMKAGGAKSGVLFGRESKGLNNDDVALADVILNVPLNPGFSSLNLAQAVLLVGYEWYQAAVAEHVHDDQLVMPKDMRPADRSEVVMMFEHLEKELDTTGFLFPPDKVPSMVRSIRNMFGRANWTEQEVRTMRGIIVALRRGPLKKKKGA